jgi:DNA-binding CsgD family transcriptional regulator
MQPRMPDRCELLFGRDNELDALRDLVANAPDAGGALVVVGDAGSGKTALLRSACADAQMRGYEVMFALGDLARLDVPFSGLHPMLRQFGAASHGLPTADRRTLAQASEPQSAADVDPPVVGRVLLDLVRITAPDRPTFLGIDDLHRFDRWSLTALTEVCRLAAGDGLSALCTTRDARIDARHYANTSLLTLGPLDDTATARMLDHYGAGLEYAQRAHILRSAAGNPLALAELPSALGSAPDVVSDIHMQRMPLTPRLQRSFAQGFLDLPVATRAAVLIAAVDDETWVHELVAAVRVFLDNDEIGLEVFDQAVHAGLLSGDDVHLDFRHNLSRAAVLHDETMARRQEARRAIAAVVPPGPLRTWHQAHSVPVPHEALGDELESACTVSLERTVVAAVATLERAAQLSVDPEKRARRLLRAAEYATALGRTDVVERYIAAAALTELSGTARVHAELLHTNYAGAGADDGIEVSALVEHARTALAECDTDRVLSLLAAAAERAWWTDAEHGTRAVISDLARLMPSDDPRVAVILALAAPVDNGREVMATLSRSSNTCDPIALRHAGLAAHLVGDCLRAAATLKKAESECRAQGLIGLLPQVLCVLAAAQVELGQLDRAIVLASEATTIAEATRQWNWAALAIAHKARAHALRNDVETAYRCAGEAERRADQRALRGVRAVASIARGAAGLSAGRALEAVDHLAPLFDRAHGRQIQRERLSAIMLAAESAVRAECADLGDAVLAQVEEYARTSPSPLLQSQLEYARALLTRDADAEPHYCAALARDLVRWPWIRARIELAYGSWLRRRRRAVESRSLLRAACATFDAMNAASWAELARAELRASGERPGGRGPALADVLSPQELEIARLAGEGLSNREIGQRLLLSHRTVGAHLYRIFPKLGITSRRQIVVHFNVASDESFAAA